MNSYLSVLQIFHTLYHTDENVLLGAPTGSGKTISAELAILHAFAEHPGEKVVYIAPMKVRLGLGFRKGRSMISGPTPEGPDLSRVLLNSTFSPALDTWGRRRLKLEVSRIYFCACAPC